MEIDPRSNTDMPPHSPYVQEVIRRIDSSTGGQSRELLRRLINSESPGNCCYGIYECPIVLDRAEGALVWDIDGKEYVDCLSGFSIANAGHGNQRVIAALEEQLGRIPQYAEMPSVPRLNFVERLVATFPGGDRAKCLLTVTGAEAVEVAVKLARWYTKRPYILVPYGDYHGVTAGTIAFTPRASLHKEFSSGTGSQQVGYFEYPYCLRCAFGLTYPGCNFHCVSVLDRLFESGTSPFFDPSSRRCDVAAVLIEPMQGSTGYIIPPDDYLTELRAFCDRYGILLIVDEIQSGLGRTGKIWAVEHSGIVPDILTTGKSLGGGVPLSAVVGRAEILDSWGLTAHGSTFGGYALGCAGGNAVLDIVSDATFLRHVRKRGDYFCSRLRHQMESDHVAASVDGRGLFIGIEFFTDAATKRPAADMAQYVRDAGLRRGLLCELSGPLGNRINLIPPLTIEEHLIDRAVDVIGTSLRDFREGRAL